MASKLVRSSSCCSWS